MASKEGGTTQTQPKNSKMLKIALIAGALIIVVLIGFIIYLVNAEQDKRREAVISSGSGTVISADDDIEDVKKAMEEPVVAGSYEAVMNNKWHFENGGEASYDAYVENSTANEFTVYFDVILENEIIYTSPMIPVGYSISEIKLDKMLDKGDYSAIATYHLVDENEEELSTVSVGITLSIEN